MLGLKTLWTTKADWILLYQSIKQNIYIFPRLILRNSFLIIILIALGSFVYQLTYKLNDKDNYLYKLIHLNEINNYVYKLCTELLFSSLEWSVLIFLISFQLYHYTKNPSEQSLSSLKNFITKNIRPLFMESTKATGIILLYFVIYLSIITMTVSIKDSALNDALRFSPTMGELNILGLFGHLLLIFLLFPSVMKLIQYLAIPYIAVGCVLSGFFIFIFINATIFSMITEGMEPNDIPAILGLCCSGFILLLFFIKTLQYVLIPYIVLFNKTFQAKGNSLKIASQLSKGIIVPIFIIFCIAVLILLFVNALLYNASSNIWILSIISSTVRVLIHIACVSIIYFMYMKKSAVTKID